MMMMRALQKKKVEKKPIKTAETGGSRQPRMSGKQKQKKAKAVVKKTKSKTETTTKKERSKTKTVVPKPDKPGAETEKTKKKKGSKILVLAEAFLERILEGSKKERSDSAAVRRRQNGQPIRDLPLICKRF